METYNSSHFCIFIQNLILKYGHLGVHDLTVAELYDALGNCGIDPDSIYVSTIFKRISEITE